MAPKAKGKGKAKAVVRRKTKEKPRAPEPEVEEAEDVQPQERLLSRGELQRGINCLKYYAKRDEKASKALEASVGSMVYVFKETSARETRFARSTRVSLTRRSTSSSCASMPAATRKPLWIGPTTSKRGQASTRRRRAASNSSSTRGLA